MDHVQCWMISMGNENEEIRSIWCCNLQQFVHLIYLTCMQCCTHDFSSLSLFLRVLPQIIADLWWWIHSGINHDHRVIKFTCMWWAFFNLISEKIRFRDVGSEKVHLWLTLHMIHMTCPFHFSTLLFFALELSRAYMYNIKKSKAREKEVPMKVVMIEETA